MSAGVEERLRIARLHDDQRLHLVLCSGQHHALDNHTLRALTSAVTEARASKRLKVVTIRGADGDFCADDGGVPGSREEAAERMRDFQALFRALDVLAVPVAAIVDGHCVGSGMEVALYASWIFANDNAEFALPAARQGCFAPFASLLLPARVSQPVADLLCLTGRRVSAREALAWGLVTDVSAEPDQVFQAFAVANLYPLRAEALRHAHRAVRAPLRRALGEDLAALQDAYLACPGASHAAE
ncbi:MAG: enoyl-CoA hydratase/isomerase family protein [Polyangiaceae bacterium]|jgi:cyclohexa-1,5-dienecarbonyl-CoA hydratase|nr:enoyl-CoA hydratase/isomerase family protein [Polyangiaceae bacterium]